MFSFVFGVVVILPLLLILSLIQNKKNKDYQKAVEARRAQEEAEKQARIREIERKRMENLSKFRQEFFSITSPNTDIQAVWKRWKLDIHDTDEQLNVQVKAKYEAIPILIDTDNYNGIFSDLIGRLYETTLISCTCDDFKINGHPCLHIYRLFYELSNKETRNPNITDINPTLLLNFNKLNNDEKKHFIDTITYMNEKGRDRFLHEDVCKEIKLGLLIKSEVEDYAALLAHMTKDEIILALAKNGIQGFRPSWSKVRLIAWTVENQQGFLRKHFKQYAHVSASPDVLSWSRGIQQSHDMWTVTHPYSWVEIVHNI